MNYLHYKTAPDNALILYFLAFMQKKKKGAISNEIKLKLKKRIESSEYWQERFEYFNLSLDHLDTGKFPTFIKNGGIPQGFKGDMNRFDFPTQKIN